MADRLKSLLCFDYDVDVVADGQALVSATDAIMADVIVCDVMMPRINGVAATRKILATHPDARIILVSVRDDAEIIGKALSSGALGYVVKTDAGEELIEATTAVLDGQQFLSSSARQAFDRRSRT